MPKDLSFSSVSNQASLVDLLLRLKTNGRETDWQEFISAHGTWLRSLCANQVHHESFIDDAMQETLLSLQHDLVEFVPSTEAAAKGWLAKIATHTACDLQRSETARRRREDSFRKDQPTEIDEGISETTDGSRIREAVLTLPDSQRRVIELRYFYSLEYPEVAEKLGLPVQQTRNLVFRAIETLRKRLGSQGKVVSAGLLPVLLQLNTQQVLAQCLENGGKAPVQTASLSKVAPATTGVSKVGVSTAVLVGSILATAGIAGGACLYAFRDSPVQKSVQEPPSDNSSVLADPVKKEGLAEFIAKFQTRHPDWKELTKAELPKFPADWKSLDIDSGQRLWRSHWFFDPRTTAALAVATVTADVPKNTSQAFFGWVRQSGAYIIHSGVLTNEPLIIACVFDGNRVEAMGEKSAEKVDAAMIEELQSSTIAMLLNVPLDAKKKPTGSTVTLRIFVAPRQAKSDQKGPVTP